METIPINEINEERYILLSTLPENKIAELYYKNFNDKYIRSSISGWYEYNKYNILKPNPSSLLNNVSKYIQELIIEEKKLIYIKLTELVLVSKSLDNEDQTEYNKYKKKDKDLKDQIKALNLAYVKAGSYNKSKSIIQYLTKYYTIDNIDDLIDNNQNYLAFSDKLYDVITGTFRNINRNDYIKLNTGYPAPLNENYECDLTIDKLLEDIFETEDIRKYWLLIHSLSLFRNNFKSIYIFEGKRSNGKSLLSEMMKIILGDYFYKGPSSCLLTKKSFNKVNPTVANIKGVRYLSLSDCNLNCDFIKMITDNDKITCSQLYNNNNISFYPKFNLFLCYNEIPNLNKLDNDTKRRLKILNYPNNFVHEPKASNEKQIDTNLKEKIKNNNFRNNVILKFLKIATENINKEIIEQPKNENKQIIISLPNKVISINKTNLEDYDYMLSWFNDKYTKTDNKKDIIKVKEIYDQYKNSSYFQNLNKLQKRQDNYKNFCAKIEDNMFLKKYFKQDSSNVNIITNYIVNIQSSDNTNENKIYLEDSDHSLLKDDSKVITLYNTTLQNHFKGIMQVKQLIETQTDEFKINNSDEIEKIKSLFI